MYVCGPVPWLLAPEPLALGSNTIQYAVGANTRLFDLSLSMCVSLDCFFESLGTLCGLRPISVPVSSDEYRLACLPSPQSLSFQPHPLRIVSPSASLIDSIVESTSLRAGRTQTKCRTCIYTLTGSPPIIHLYFILHPAYSNTGCGWHLFSSLQFYRSYFTISILLLFFPIYALSVILADPRSLPNQPTNQPCHMFLCLNDRYHNNALFCENRMFGKNPVLDLWPKMVLTNQIARFFKFEYLRNGLTV